MMRIVRQLMQRNRQPESHMLKAVYQPEPPATFVRRSDPNFYFLTRR